MWIELQFQRIRSRCKIHMFFCVLEWSRHLEKIILVWDQFDRIQIFLLLFLCQKTVFTILNSKINFSTAKIQCLYYLMCLASLTLITSVKIDRCSLRVWYIKKDFSSDLKLSFISDCGYKTKIFCKRGNFIHWFPFIMVSIVDWVRNGRSLVKVDGKWGLNLINKTSKSGPTWNRKVDGQQKSNWTVLSNESRPSRLTQDRPLSCVCPPKGP